ncbi:hypothetical protein ES703_37372 [subsurface metagenome]
MALDEAKIGHGFNHPFTLFRGPAEGHHDLDIGQPHLISGLEDGLALQTECLPKALIIVTGGPPPANHGVRLLWLIEVAADEVGVLIALKIREAHNDIFGIEACGNPADALGQFIDKEFLFILWVGCGHLIDSGYDLLDRRLFLCPFF